MNRNLIRRLAVCVFAIYLLVVIWPLAALFRSAEPFVFGLPLSMAWPVGWILIGFITLLILDHAENKGSGE